MRRSHVEARAYNFNPPRQYVSETHDHKPTVCSSYLASTTQ